jgi:tetratricopeptide (TPR) repeat protein
LWEVIGASAAHQKNADWIDCLRDKRTTHESKTLPPEIVDRILHLSFVFRGDHLPKMPGEIDFGSSKSSAQTEAASLYLLLQSIVPLTGETGFFQDVQSLLYLHLVHYFLPHLQTNRRPAEYALLVNVMHIHAIVVWRDQPSHMFYLLGALMGQLGQNQARLQCLERALSATPVYDHSYLTKANAYWGELLELDQRDEAMELLLKLSRNVPESYAEEIGEMIKETAVR